MDIESPMNASRLGDAAPRKAFVFVSHDTRDALIAKAFAELLSSLSAGILKTFCSSDKRGSGGISYGVDWYPELMKQLDTATDVVCLLTPNSVGRPWILYEAGVAKGKLDVSVHGVALGLSLGKAATGPFAQFQNCDDSEDSLTQLVTQLLSRLPDSSPDRSVVLRQVRVFKETIGPLFATADSPKDSQEDERDTEQARRFEEIKAMFLDITSRFERANMATASEIVGNERRFDSQYMYDLMHWTDIESYDPIVLILAFSFLRNDFPWLFEMAANVHRKLESRSPTGPSALRQFVRIFKEAIRRPTFHKLLPSSRQSRDELEGILAFADYVVDRMLEGVERNLPLFSQAQNE